MKNSRTRSKGYASGYITLLTDPALYIYIRVRTYIMYIESSGRSREMLRLLGRYSSYSSEWRHGVIATHFDVTSRNEKYNIFSQERAYTAQKMLVWKWNKSTWIYVVRSLRRPTRLNSDTTSARGSWLNNYPAEYCLLSSSRKWSGAGAMRNRICCLSCYKDAAESLDRSGCDGDDVGSRSLLLPSRDKQCDRWRQFVSLNYSRHSEHEVRINYIGIQTDVQTMEENIVIWY